MHPPARLVCRWCVLVSSDYQIRNQQDPVAKIDDQAVNGLAGVPGSLAYLVAETENHLHAYARWFGAAVSPDGEDHVADEIGATVTPFQTDAGDNDWGAWVQVMGATDTPFEPGMVQYDMHRLSIIASERTAFTFIQVAFGTDGTAALAAYTYTATVYSPALAASNEGPIDIQGDRHAAGTKAWVRTFVPGQSTGTFDFFIGFHEYPG